MGKPSHFRFQNVGLLAVKSNLVCPNLICSKGKWETLKEPVTFVSQNVGLSAVVSRDEPSFMADGDLF